MENNPTNFDFDALTTHQQPPPYQSSSTPLPRQQTRTYQSTNSQFAESQIDNTSTLESVKQFVSKRINNISSDISSSLDNSIPVDQQTNLLNSFITRLPRQLSNTINDSSNKSLKPAVSDSLERIGASLQNLIEEAEASLLGPSNYAKNKLYLSQERILPATEDANDTLGEYAYRYLQHVHSQEKLTATMDQLEQSVVQSMINNNNAEESTVIHHHHHHYIEQQNNNNTPQRRDPEDDDSNKPHSITLIATLVIVVIGYISTRRRRPKQYRNMGLILVLILLLLYRKRNIVKRHMGTGSDRFNAVFFVGVEAFWEKTKNMSRHLFFWTD